MTKRKGDTNEAAIQILKTKAGPVTQARILKSNIFAEMFCQGRKIWAI